jgi:hypothetical protein
MANEVDEFLSGLDNQPKDDPFKPEEKDPLGTPEEKKEEKPAEEKEEKLPYHKDPKVQRFIEKEVARRFSEMKPPEPQYIEKEKEESPDVIGALETIIGNDTPEKVRALKSFEKALKDVEENASRRAIQELESQRDEEVAEEAAAFEELSRGFEAIEDEHDVDLTSNTPAARKMRSEFVDFITAISPKDEYGQVKDYPDLDAAFSLFKDQRKSDAPANLKAKELAARGMQRSADASNAPVTTDKSWSAVDRIFGNLFK